MKVKVSEVAILNRKQLQYKNRFDVIHYLDTSSVYKGKFDALQTLSVGVDDIPSRAQRAVRDGTIVISTVRPNLEHYGYFEHPSENVIVSSGFVTVDAIPEKVDSKYLYYVLTSPRTIAYLISISATAVSSYPSFNPDDLASFEIEIEDDIKEQKRIAESLSYIDSKISNNNAICADLEAMAKLLYDYWFVQFDFPDENGKPYKSSGGKMVWNEELKREIPEGWTIGQIGTHIQVKRGISYSSEDLRGKGFPMINLNSFNTDATYKADGLKTYSGKVQPDKISNPFDLVICATQQTAIDLSGKTNVIGKALLIPDIFNSSVVTSMDLITLICDDALPKAYLKYVVNQQSIHKYIVGFANGTKIKHLDINGLLELVHEIPNSNIVNNFNSLVMELEAKKSQIIKENEQLSSLRDFLLPMLMNGQITVSGPAADNT